MLNPTILFVGCGNMGAAIMAGAMRALPQARLVGLDPDLERARGLLPASVSIELHADIAGLKDLNPDMVILGVKPQIFGQLDTRLMDMMARTPTVSIMAGVPLSRLVEVIGQQRIVRVMPNLPSVLGEGMSLGCVNSDQVPPEVLHMVELLFAAIGRFEWAPDEELFERANPIFSCGPGFVFAFAEQMVRAAVASGLPEHLADALVRQTFLGSARMLAEDARTPAEMKRAVTSPNGTTQAGLTALEADAALPKIIPETFERAYRRALELAAQS